MFPAPPSWKTLTKKLLVTHFSTVLATFRRKGVHRITDNTDRSPNIRGRVVGHSRREWSVLITLITECLDMQRVVLAACLMAVVGTSWAAIAQAGGRDSEAFVNSTRQTGLQYQAAPGEPASRTDSQMPVTGLSSADGSIVPDMGTFPLEGTLARATTQAADAGASEQTPVVASATPAAVVEEADVSGANPERVPWNLPQPSFLSNHGIKVGGWIQQGITFNGDHPADHYNGPMLTNDFSNRYQMNQAWLYFVKPTQTDGCGVDLGGRVDVVYGTDWRIRSVLWAGKPL